MYTFFTSDIAGLSANMANWIATGLVALIGLILLYMLYRLIRRPRLAGGRRSKQARLAITDAALIDERRKLVLVRRDDVEHLVLIGGATDMVIESNIRRNTPARPLKAAPPSAPVTTQGAAGRPITPPPAPAKPVPATAPVVAPAPVAVPAPAPSSPLSPIPPISPVASAPPSTVAPVVASVGAGLAAAAVGTAAMASDVADTAKDAVSDATEAVSDTVETTKEEIQDVAPEVKSTSAVDDMDALLSEITADKAP